MAAFDIQGEDALTANQGGNSANAISSAFGDFVVGGSKGDDLFTKALMPVAVAVVIGLVVISFVRRR